jgi:hypothetical protein
MVLNFQIPDRFADQLVSLQLVSHSVSKISKLSLAFHEQNLMS